jgi:hypothetical protein
MCSLWRLNLLAAVIADHPNATGMIQWLACLVGCSANGIAYQDGCKVSLLR